MLEELECGKEIATFYIGLEMQIYLLVMSLQLHAQKIR